ncbi:MAG: DUF4417 domain-containing protein [Slackia sp.]|nr:DUF4417 domain-containing protein [Slackia sp.]
MLSQLKACEEIYVLLDFLPQTENATIMEFYELRKLQIVQYISDRLSGIAVLFMDSPEALRLQTPTRLTLPWLIRIAESYIDVITRAGIPFDAEGFPLIPTRSYANTIPADMIDWPHRRARYISKPGNTAICFFTKDSAIYPRFEKIFDEVGAYRNYAAVVMPDITVTSDMDTNWQSFTMLLNHLFGAVLAAQGIKIIANTRCGSVDSRHHLKAIPRKVLCASGNLGCTNTASVYDYSYAEKILSIAPSSLLTYGKRDEIAIDQLTTMGIPIATYLDSHARKNTEIRPRRTSGGPRIGAA